MEFRALLNSIKLSALTGGLKVFCQILVSLLVFPKIILDAGIPAVGSWVMLQLTIGYGGLVNLGMGPVLVKWNSKFTFIEKSAKQRPIDRTTRNYFGASLTSGFFLFFLISAILTLWGRDLVSLVQEGIADSVPSSTIWIMFVAVILRFYSSLYGALLTSFHKNEYVNISQSVQLIIFILVFFLLPDSLNILYRLALAYAVGYMVEIFLATLFVFKTDRNLLKIFPSFSFSKLNTFYQHVYPFFLMDLALIGREPLVKYTAFLLGGSSYVGIFELATKVPFAIRQAFVVGLSSLMPAFVALTEKGEKEAIIKLGSLSLLYVLFGAIGSLIIYGLNAEFLLSIWLGVDIDNLLVESTIILTFWWAISSLNVPAWWLGIGTNKTWFNTMIAGVHFVISLCLLLMVALNVEITFKELILYWVLGGIAMQIFLYWFTEIKTGLVKKIYLSKKPVITFLYFVLSVVILGLLLEMKNEFEITAHGLLVISVILVIFPPVIYFLKTKRLG